ILAENHSLNPEVRERFIGEGRSLRKVRSGHVVAVHDLGETDRQQPYLVLDHADRGALQQRVENLWRSGWRASAADVLAVARPLAEAIGAVHAAGLVHRDLSPGNLLLRTVPDPSLAPGAHTRTAAAHTASEPAQGSAATVITNEEQLVVADLGLCKDLAMHSGLTVAGGTSGFRPPEQRGGPATVDTRSDLWAMSQLLTWLTAGADLPGRLHAALQRSLAEDPTDRHRDVQAWLADIEAALAPAPDPAVRPWEERGPRRPRRPRRTVALTVLAVRLLCAGALAGVLAAQRLGEPSGSTEAAQIDITGPTQVQLGQQATFTATTRGVDSWVWILPDGTYITDQDTVTLTARSSGAAELTLRARSPDGVALRVVHQIGVTE